MKDHHLPRLVMSEQISIYPSCVAATLIVDISCNFCHPVSVKPAIVIGIVELYHFIVFTWL